MSLSKRDKILVLVVDLDDDVGAIGVKTPVLGYKDILETTIRFGLNRPDDSDLNALFKALQLYERLSKEGYCVDVALVSGFKGDPFKSFTKITNELSTLKEETGFTHIYFVSDGAVDENVLPIVSNYGRVVGVERSLVEQHRGVEETYILLGRYIKKAFTEQPYVKYFLGVPGLIIFAYLTLNLLGLGKFIFEFSLLVFSILMIGVGFGIADKIRDYWRASVFSGILLVMSISLLIYCLIVVIFVLHIDGFTFNSLVKVVNYSTYPVTIGLILLLSARVFYKVITNDPKVIFEAIYGSVVVFITVYLVELNNKLMNVKGEVSVDELINIFGVDPAFIFTALVSIMAISLMIIFIEEKFKKTSR